MLKVFRFRSLASLAAADSTSDETTASESATKSAPKPQAKPSVRTLLAPADQYFGPGKMSIVGMPRAGSTLVEQILASHSLVEGTSELPLLKQLTIELSYSRILVTPDAYPQCLLRLTQEQLAAHGACFIERARAFRNTDRPFFVDKRPSNWLEAGLIHLILPHAKIIDIRREPMAACFAMYKQILPMEMNFATDLGNLGHYYNNYVNMMDHWRSVLPGRIHFLRYERLVEDTEGEIRRLLEYCGLPFEESCLRFWDDRVNECLLIHWGQRGRVCPARQPLANSGVGFHLTYIPAKVVHIGRIVAAIRWNASPARCAAFSGPT